MFPVNGLSDHQREPEIEWAETKKRREKVFFFFFVWERKGCEGQEREKGKKEKKRRARWIDVGRQARRQNAEKREEEKGISLPWSLRRVRYANQQFPTITNTYWYFFCGSPCRI